MCLRIFLKIALFVSISSGLYVNISIAAPVKHSFLTRLINQYPRCINILCHIDSVSISNSLKNYSYLRLIESGIPLLQYYVEALASENLPAYYSVIPLLESRNSPLAESPAGAKGLWQLMPSTAYDKGAFFGYQNDMRTDIYISTKAAVSLLKELHVKYLGNPDLVLAAYNWGPANVDKNLTNIYSHLPEETKKYLISFYKIGDELRNLNLENRLWRYPDVHYLKTVRSKEVTIESVDVQADLFNFLNPNYIDRENWVVPTELFYNYFGVNLNRPNYISTNLRNRNLILDCYKDLSSQNSSYFYVYITKQGDSISMIAKRFSLSKNETSRLMRIYPQIDSGMVIKLSKQPDGQGGRICMN
jgi:hypothetical protein